MQKTQPFLQAASLALVIVFVAALSVSGDIASSTGLVIARQSGPSAESLTVRSITTVDGRHFTAYVINGPPHPSGDDEARRKTISLPENHQEVGAKILEVPAYKWSFGSGATSGAMIAAYYDRNGYPNMYTGPTNGGIMPLTSAPWPDWRDGYRGGVYAQNPLAATRNGLDGRTSRGSIDDYWVTVDFVLDDPYITHGWTQHPWGDAIGDYMKTSQSAYGNTDGSTTIITYSNRPEKLRCKDMPADIKNVDGNYGRKLFYNARGYFVTDCYNQLTDNQVAGGFSFADYKAEIDANRPVMLSLSGRFYDHIIVGIGYNDTDNTAYINDTWDYETHSMIWGGGYSALELMAASVVNLIPDSDLIRIYTPFITRH